MTTQYSFTFCDSYLIKLSLDKELLKFNGTFQEYFVNEYSCGYKKVNLEACLNMISCNISS